MNIVGNSINDSWWKIYHTSKFVKQIEELMGFKIKTIQTDNGSEFVNNQEETMKKHLWKH